MPSKILKTSRFQILTTVIILVSILLLGRLFQKQIIQHKYYKALAQQQYMIEKELPSERGEIFVADRYDEPFPVAVNIKYYDLLLIPKNISDSANISKKLAGLIDMTEKEIFELIDNKKPYIPPIKKKIDSQTAKKIEELNLTGVMLVSNPGRFYPENNLAAHVLGFVDSEKQGRYGIEGYYNQILIGDTGTMLSEKEELGHFFNISQKLEISKGSDLYLTIDRNIQFMAEDKLKNAIQDQQAESGSIIIIEPKTGKVLAMANYPTFDPNKYNEIESYDVFSNPSIAYSFEPGSIFKIIGMSAAIDSEKVTPETEGVFGSKVQVDEYTIETATQRAYGRETMTEVLENSDNVAMVWVAQQLGSELFHRYIEKFGFGQKTGIDLETENSPQILPQKSWRNSHLATISFGQGVAVTPLQMVTSLTGIANKGKILQPYILDRIKEPDGKEIVIEPKQILEPISEDTALKLKEMMVSVIDNGYGKKAQIEGYRVAGKTGTAQIPDSELGGYLEDIHICSFIGFAPADDPAFVMIVKIDKPKSVLWAADSVAPVFGQMSEWLLNYLQIYP